MIHIKTPQEIASMRKAGEILADVLFAVLKEAKPGVSEMELDALAEKMIREKGGEPGFMRVPGWKHAVCVSTNDVVVHGIPTFYQLAQGDIIGIDCGVVIDDMHTDMSESVRVVNGKPRFYDGTPVKDGDEVDRFLQIGKKALNEAIAQVKPGNHVGHVSQKIQEIVEGAGYSIVRSLVGHGVGKELHEEPEVPGYIRGAVTKTPLLRPGMMIAVEVIYNMGKRDVVYAGGDDEWTIKTKDGSLAGLYERTVLVTPSGYEIITE